MSRCLIYLNCGNSEKSSVQMTHSLRVLNKILKSPPMVFLHFEVTEQMTAEMGTVP